MTAKTESISREEAVSALNQGYMQVYPRLMRLSDEELTRRGLGGGDWSVKDLLGHLTSWESYAIAALEAWASRRPAEINRVLRTDGLHAVNARAVEEKRDLSCEVIRRQYQETHARLISAIEETSDDAWAAPPTSRATRSLGDSLGSILSGSRPFSHVDAHLTDLIEWLASMKRSA